MPRITKFNSKRSFRGNQHLSVCSTTVRPRPTDEPCFEKSSSSKKLHGSKLPKDFDYTDTQEMCIRDR